jgi:hypothetical protein
MKRDVKTMWESTTFQEIWAQGEKNMLRLVGTERFGEPSAATLARLEEFKLVEEIDRLVGRFFKVESWDELLK